MEERSITITIDKAREWYNSKSDTLKKAALQAFSENELKFDFKSITSFKKACEALDIDYDNIDSVIGDIIIFGGSISSATILKLDIIRRALNLGHDLPFTKNSKNSLIYYPYNPCVNKNSILYKDQLNSGRMEIIGKIKVGETEYNILGGDTTCCYANLGSYGIYNSLVGCATREIAEHFSKYFGMTIIEAKYSNLKDFEIIRTF